MNNWRIGKYFLIIDLLLISLMVVLFLPNIQYALIKQPFPHLGPDVQKQVFHEVRRYLHYAKYVENPPPLIRGEDLTDEEFAAAIENDIFGNKRGNFYSWRLDVVILAEDYADVDSLAHEYVHYYQCHFYFNGKPLGYQEEVAEMEAVDVQQHFK